MKVVVCGMWREATGFGRASREVALALHEAGADVACRAVQFTPNKTTEHPVVRELERKTFAGTADAVLQNVPPYVMAYDRKAGRNAGMFFCETSPVHAGWAARASLLDLTVVPDEQSAFWLKNSPQHTKPVAVVGLPSEPSQYLKDFPAPPAVADFKRGRFLFYTIGEHSRRKNLSGLLRAYFAEFKPWEPVGLVVKTGIENKTGGQARRTVEDEIDKVREGCRMASIPPVMVMADRLDEQGVCGLHQACDQFVSVSYGECWGYPAFDALGFGKTPIVSDTGGHREFVDRSVGWLVPTRAAPVFAAAGAHPELFSGRQTWDEPDLLALQIAMRSAYSHPALKAAKAENARARVSQFSRRLVGERLLGVLKDGSQGEGGRTQGLG
jgi:glycosyltransferase involved in cell wall biosynthesis